MSILRSRLEIEKKAAIDDFVDAYWLSIIYYLFIYHATSTSEESVMFGKKDREKAPNAAQPIQQEAQEKSLEPAPPVAQPDHAGALPTSGVSEPAHTPAPTPTTEPAISHAQEHRPMNTAASGEQFSIKARGSEELKNESFSEVSAPGMKAYGISIESKVGRYTHMLEMLAFCRDAHIAGINQFIKSMSYEEGVCNIEFAQGEMAGTSVALIARYIGRERLSKFSVLGQVEPGLARPCDGK